MATNWLEVSEPFQETPDSPMSWQVKDDFLEEIRQLSVGCFMINRPISEILQDV